MFLDPKFWLAISFLIFLTLIAKYVIPKILASLDNQSKKIAEEIELAKQAKEKAEELLLEAKKYHEESLLYCQKLIRDAKEEAEKLLLDSNRALAEDLQKKIDLAKNRIKLEEEKTVRDIKSNIIASAIKAIEQKSTQVSEQISAELAKKAVADIGKTIH